MSLVSLMWCKVIDNIITRCILSLMSLVLSITLHHIRLTKLINDKVHLVIMLSITLHHIRLTKLINDKVQICGINLGCFFCFFFLSFSSPSFSSSSPLLPAATPPMKAHLYLIYKIYSSITIYNYIYYIPVAPLPMKAHLYLISIIYLSITI
jgi:hypothetical protein